MIGAGCTGRQPSWGIPASPGGPTRDWAVQALGSVGFSCGDIACQEEVRP